MGFAGWSASCYPEHDDVVTLDQYIETPHQRQLVTLFSHEESLTEEPQIIMQLARAAGAQRASRAAPRSLCYSLVVIQRITYKQLENINSP